MILSIDFRTDIPAFYHEWIVNRFNAGFLMFRNPVAPNTVHKVIQGYITANIPETMFFALYYNYVDTIKEDLDPIFLKIIDYLKHSDELNRYNNLVLKYNLTKLGI